MSDEENKQIEEKKQVEETTADEDTTPDAEKVQDVEQRAEEKPVMEAGEKDNKVDTTGSEAENKEAKTTAGEHHEASESEVEEEEEKQEEEKTTTTEEASEEKDEQSKEGMQFSEDMQAELEELRYTRDEEIALKEIGQAQAHAQSEMQEFQTRVTQILEQGLKHYGIDPEKSIEDIAKEDPAKADIARELLNSAQQHIQAKQQELIQKVGEMEQNVVFNRAEREIKKFKLTAEQEIEAAKMLVRIINTTGVADISEDLKEKVRLAVASAKMSVPMEEMIKKEENSDIDSPSGRTSDTTVQGADISVSETPSEKIEEKTEEKTEEKPETTPEVDIDDYKESPTDTANTTISTAPEINEANVLAKMAAMPYKDRVAFMIEHQDVVDAAMRKESARRERERRKI